nr:hypothetical protein [Tanacetum cinerariifolium]
MDHRTHMFLKGVHMCSNEFDEKAHLAHMFLEGYSFLLTNLMKSEAY